MFGGEKRADLQYLVDIPVHGPVLKQTNLRDVHSHSARALPSSGSHGMEVLINLL